MTFWTRTSIAIAVMGKTAQDGDFEFTLESDEEGIDDEEKGDGALNPRRRRTIAGCCNTRQRNDPPCRYSFPVAP